MKVGYLRELLQAYTDNDEVVCMLVTKEEVNEQMISFFGDEYAPVTEQEYLDIVNDFATNDGLHQEIDDAVSETIDRMLNERGNTNVFGE